jgi:hypothetical protein
LWEKNNQPGETMAKKTTPAPKWSDWITRDKKRAILSFVGAAFVAMVGGLWAAFQYFDKPDVKMEVSYKLCVGEFVEKCPPGTIRVKSSGDTKEDIANWVKKECSRYSKRQLSGEALYNQCECGIVEVKCSTQ